MTDLTPLTLCQSDCLTLRSEKFVLENKKKRAHDESEMVRQNCIIDFYKHNCSHFYLTEVIKLNK